MTELSSVRILHLTTSFPLQPDSVSGIFIYRLITRFPAEIERVVLTPASKGPVNPPAGDYSLHTFRYAPQQFQILAHEAGGLPVALRDSKWLFFLLPCFLTAMFVSTIVHARSSDVIHAHWTLNGFMAGIAGFLTRTPVITTLRGEDVNRSHSSLLRCCLLHMCLKLSNHVATVSSEIRKDIFQKYPQLNSKITFIPNGVSSSLLTLPQSRRASVPTILVLGSLIPRKGVDLTITALAQGCREWEWKLVIAGLGPEKEKLEVMVAQERLEERVWFAGQVPPDRVAELLAESDILVQASYGEGRPNSVLEAMAAGVAVVGSDIGGINELVVHGKNGLLFSPGGTEELSEQLQILLGSKSLRVKLGEAGRQTIIANNLLWQKCVDSYLDLYKQIVM